MNTIKQIFNFIYKNSSAIIEDLKQFIQAESITGNNCKDRCVEYVTNLLYRSGFKKVNIFGNKISPIIYATTEFNPTYKTVLIYGHYDVQPYGNTSDWRFDPTSANVENNRIFGRGSSDDKGQVFAHIKAVELFRSHYENKVPLNIKILLDGEEENGSESFYDFVEQNLSLLNADCILSSDSNMIKSATPTICICARGICYFEVTIRRKCTKILHSGLFVGIANNPINILSLVINTISGLIWELNNQCTSFDKKMDKIISDLNMEELEKNRFRKIWGKYSFDCHAIKTNVECSEKETVIPSCAVLKASIRIPPCDLSKDDINKKLKKIIHQIELSDIEVDLKILGQGDPFYMEESPAISCMKEALEEVFLTKPYLVGEGGGMPVLGYLKKKINAEAVLSALGEETDNIHAPNESFSIDNLFNGIKSTILFLKKYSSIN